MYRSTSHAEEDSKLVWVSHASSRKNRNVVHTLHDAHAGRPVSSRFLCQLRTNSQTYQGSSYGNRRRYCCRQHCERGPAALSRCAPADASTTLRKWSLAVDAKNMTIKVLSTKIGSSAQGWSVSAGSVIEDGRALVGDRRGNPGETVRGISGLRRLP